jgi:hypothetical protein
MGTFAMTDVPLSSSTLAVASTLCHGFPNTCQTHIQETLDVLRLIPNLLQDIEIVRAAALARTPNLNSMHPADQTVLLADALACLAGAGREIAKDVIA